MNVFIYKHKCRGRMWPICQLTLYKWYVRVCLWHDAYLSQGWRLCPGCQRLSSWWLWQEFSYPEGCAECERWVHWNADDSAWQTGHAACYPTPATAPHMHTNLTVTERTVNYISNDCYIVTLICYRRWVRWIPLLWALRCVPPFQPLLSTLGELRRLPPACPAFYCWHTRQETSDLPA